ncbi:hypothetical protein L3Q82_019481, partial [Scortum barcoo]
SKKLITSEEFVHILSDDQSNSTTLPINPQERNKIPIPRPPKGRQKPVPMYSVRKTQPANEVRNSAQVAHQENLDQDSLDYMDYVSSLLKLWGFYVRILLFSGSEGLRFDDHGMVLPHSILGSLEDFRSYLEAKGETELVKRIPKSQRDHPSEATGKHCSEAEENVRGISTGYRNIQSNALQHWHAHMTQRRRQQDFLSDLLDRPVENLLMNKANHFRETQEQRELLNRVMPLIHSGYGYRAGSEFWSLPQRYGDEMSGITATLTQTEQGRQEPITHVAQPSSIRQESGTHRRPRYAVSQFLPFSLVLDPVPSDRIICAETLRPPFRTWDQSSYLQHQCQGLGDILRDMDIKKPDIDGLEVIGSAKPFTFATACPSPLLEKKEVAKERKEMKNESLDPLAQYDDVQSGDLFIPALRFCGQLATWTGNSTTNQGEVGISATIVFEALNGERASSHLELHNEGSTAIFYSWQQFPLAHSFPHLRSQTKSPHFYFDSSSGVILPGETQRVEFVFKSEAPGIKTELWQLNTHPMLLQGASMQVTLRGVALYQDKTADQRLFIEKNLEKIVTVKMCRSIVNKMLQGVHTPERPSSPAELYFTEEQEFLSKNPKLQYHDQPAEDLQRLWQEVNPGQTWDYSIDMLRQVVLSLPEQDSAQEKSLAQLNSLRLQLSEPSELKNQITAAAVGQQLWRKLLDTMADKAMWLKNLLGLPERGTWIDKKEEISDAEVADNRDEKTEKKGGPVAKEERSGAKSRLRDDNKGESNSATAEKSVEDSRKKGKRRDNVTKRTREKQGRESASLTEASAMSISQQRSDDEGAELEVMDIYTRLLHQKA